jgi:hypothetical protein
MNVIGTRPDAWWKDRHAAMVRLVHLLESWVAHAPRPRRDSADDEIVRRVAGEREPGQIRVVTSDLWLVDRVHAAGASVQPADSFRAQLEGD